MTHEVIIVNEEKNVENENCRANSCNINKNRASKRRKKKVSFITILKHNYSLPETI